MAFQMKNTAYYKAKFKETEDNSPINKRIDPNQIK